MNKNADEYEKLEAIAGKDEFLAFLRYAENNPELYTGDDNNFKNVEEGIFQANFHIHTTNSDGRMDVSEFLNMAARYADKVASIHPGKKLFLAITDHDTVNGDKEALEIIFNNPKKYKNLRLVLGAEVSSLLSSPYMKQARDAHLLHYCLNPYDTFINDLTQNRLKLLHSDIQEALQGAEKEYRAINEKYQLQYSLDEIIKMRPQLKLFPHDARLTMKDYLQFKILFADRVLENKEVMSFLNAYGINRQDLDFTVPKFMLKIALKRPYWLNYVDRTGEYLEKMIKERNSNADIAKFRDIFNNKPFDSKLESTLTDIENNVMNPRSPIYIKYADGPASFDTIVQMFANSTDTVSGIAHPAYTLRDEWHNPQKLLLAQDFVGRFKEIMGDKNIIVEKHYAYERVQKEWINMFYTVTEHIGYISSGGRDSHRNNFFSRYILMTDEDLARLTQAPQIIPNALLLKKGIGRS